MTEVNKKWIDSMWERIDKKLAKTAVELRDTIPYLIHDGKYEDMERVTGKELFTAWNRLLRSAYIRVNVVGESLPEGLMEAVGAAFSAIARENITSFDGFKTPTLCSDIEVTERMDIAQGKLVMAFSAGEVGPEKDTGAKMVMADIFGGGPYSRLFANVRERLSLCYYCACRMIKNKGYMLVDSGVESTNVEKAQKEILNQLDIMKKGEFTDEEFASSIRSICDGIGSASDSAATLDYWYASRVFDDSVPEPNELLAVVKNVTREDVVAAAQSVELCVVYKLLPQEK